MDGELSFGSWLSRRRKALGLSRAELARRSACATVSLRKIEEDARRPSAQLAALLASHLALSPAEHTLFVRVARGERRVEHLPPADRLQMATTSGSRAPIPVPPTALIGREADIATVCGLLKREEVRLVTLMGPPGIGKTRLSLAVAAQMRDAYPDGVFFVPIAPVHDPTLVMPTIARALGIAEQTQITAAEQLHKALRDKRMLLIIDNYEHLTASARQLAELLTVAPQLQCIATSRAALLLSGEQRYIVPALALPSPGATIEQIMGTPAVELFVQRAQAVLSAFHPTELDILQIAAICRRLDGLPLALELAAARVALFSPQELLIRLDRRLSLLTAGAIDLPVRQQTLRGAIAWSEQLLTPPEQALFRQLAVFVGDWTVEAVESVSSALGGAPIDCLTRLVDQSLVQRKATTDGQTRYLMLEIMREYALEQLAATGTLADAQSIHARYYVKLAEQTNPALQNDNARHWLALLEREHDNLRAALAWLLGHQSTVADAARLIRALIPFWWRESHYREAIHWLTRVLTQGDTVETALRAELLRGIAPFAVRLGDYALANAWLEESLSISQLHKDAAGEGETLHLLAEAAFAAGDRMRGAKLAEAALPIVRAACPVATVAGVLDDLARNALDLGETERGITILGESLALLQRNADAWGTADTLHTLAHAVRDQGNSGRALELYQTALECARRLDEPDWVMGVLISLTVAFANEGATAAANETYHESLALFTKLDREGDPPEAAAWRCREMARATAEIDDARTAALLTVSLRAARAQHLSGQWRITAILTDVARLLSRRGQDFQATALFGAAAASRGDDAVPWRLGERHEYERDRLHAQARMDEQSFNNAWEAGRKLTPAEAIAVSLAALDHPA